MKRSPLLFSIICLILTFPLEAKEKKTLSSKIQEFFDQTNIPANISEGDAFNDDVIGVNFLGGTGYIRTQVSDLNPVHVSLPRLSVGCGGIDYTMGALNIVSKDEMKKALLNIAKNAGTHAFLLALETTSPLTAGVMAKVQHWSNQLNAININSCEIGTSIVEGLWPTNTKASEYICAHAGAREGVFGGLIEARHGCRDAKNKMTQETINHIKKEGVLIGDYNLAWEVIKNMHLPDKNVRDLYLNISGTILHANERFTFYPSQAEKALDILMFGGSLENAYRFKDKPLEIEKSAAITVPIAQSEKYRIERVLNSLQSKILNEGLGEEQGLSEEEKDLIANTQFPISSLMVLMGQWGGKNVAKHVSSTQCAEIIAFERVSKYIEEIIKNLLLQAEAIQSKQINTDAFKEFKRGLEQTLVFVERLKVDNHRKLDEKQKLIKFLIDIENNMRDNPGAAL